MMGKTQIELQDVIRIGALSHYIGEKQLLNAVSLDLRKGSLTALLGENGAGKTTLLKCLLGIVKPSSGSLEICGEDIQSYSRIGLARELAYVPQLLESKVDFTVLDFVMMGRYAYQGGFSYHDKDGAEVVKEALNKVGMSDFSNRTLHTLSGGERQKVCIAAALAQQSSILILDEPTAHLDPYQRDEIQSLLAHIAKQEGLSVLVVTHDLNWVSMSFDYMYGMKLGKVVVNGAVDEVFNQDNLHQLFGVDFTMIEHPVTKRLMVLPSVRKETRC